MHFFFFIGCIHSIRKILGQGSNPSCSCDLFHSWGDAGSLTCCATVGTLKISWMAHFQCTNGRKEAQAIDFGPLFPADILPILWIWWKSQTLASLSLILFLTLLAKQPTTSELKFFRSSVDHFHWGSVYPRHIWIQWYLVSIKLWGEQKIFSISGPGFWVPEWDCEHQEGQLKNIAGVGALLWQRQTGDFERRG